MHRFYRVTDLSQIVEVKKQIVMTWKFLELERLVTPLCDFISSVHIRKMRVVVDAARKLVYFQ